MKPENSEHPIPEQLADFALGRLTPELRDDVERHISECDQCCQTALSASNDSFVDALRNVESFVTDFNLDRTADHNQPYTAVLTPAEPPTELLPKT